MAHIPEAKKKYTVPCNATDITSDTFRREQAGQKLI